MMTDFRTQLRLETAADHDRVDTLFTGIDIAEFAGFTRFLEIHLACFRMMLTRSTGNDGVFAILIDLIRRIEDDLSTLGVWEIDQPSLQLDKIDPLALDYMVAGSRLGTKVLRKRWGSTDDRRVRAAERYFGFEGGSEYWKTVCNMLSAIPADSERAATITRDVKALFALFVNCHDRVNVTTVSWGLCDV